MSEPRRDDDPLGEALTDPAVWPAPLPPDRLRRAAERALADHLCERLRDREPARTGLAPREVLGALAAGAAAAGAAVWAALAALDGAFTGPEAPGQGSFPGLPGDLGLERVAGALGAWAEGLLSPDWSGSWGLAPASLPLWALTAAVALWALLPPLPSSERGSRR